MKQALTYFTIIVMILLCESFIFESNNHRAIRVFRSQVKYIETCMKKKPEKAEKLIETIQTTEQITGIASESGMDIFGRRFYPTPNDIARWNDWLKKNKDKLRWDKKQKNIYLYVEKKPAGTYYQL